MNGKLLYAHPPPGIDADEFNAESRDLDRLRLLEKVRIKRAPVTRVGKEADTFIPSQGAGAQISTNKPNSRSSALDRDFFAALQSNPGNARFLGAANVASGGRVQTAPHQRSIGPDGRPLQMPDVLVVDQSNSKKHNKGNKRA